MKIRLYERGVRISASFWFFAVLALFFVFDEDGLALYFLLPVFAHELGHLTAMRLLGVKIRSVRLSAFGIAIQKEGGLKLSYAKEIIVAAAGAFANLGLALVFSFFPHDFDEPGRVTLFMAANIAVAAFNMLPIGGLDGGSLLKLSAERFLPQGIAFVLSRVFSFLILVPIFALSFFLIMRPERNFTLLAVSVYLAANVIRECR